MDDSIFSGTLDELKRLIYDNDSDGTFWGYKTIVEGPIIAMGTNAVLKKIQKLPKGEKDKVMSAIQKISEAPDGSLLPGNSATKIVSKKTFIVLGRGNGAWYGGLCKKKEMNIFS